MFAFFSGGVWPCIIGVCVAVSGRVGVVPHDLWGRSTCIIIYLVSKTPVVYDLWIRVQSNHSLHSELATTNTAAQNSAHITAMDKQSLQDWLTWSFSPSISAMIITFLVALLLPISIHVYLYRSRASTVIPAFLVVGPSGAGKTSLLTRVWLRTSVRSRECLR